MSTDNAITEYRIGEYSGAPRKPALFNKRGLVCIFEAGYQQTREQDAEKVLRAVNAHAALLSACEDAAFIIRGGDSDDKLEPWARELCAILEAAIKKAGAA